MVGLFSYFAIPTFGSNGGQTPCSTTFMIARKPELACIHSSKRTMFCQDTKNSVTVKMLGNFIGYKAAHRALRQAQYIVSLYNTMEANV